MYALHSHMAKTRETSNIRPPAAVSYIAAAKFKNEWLKYKLDVFLGVTYFFISNVYVKKIIV